LLRGDTGFATSGGQSRRSFGSGAGVEGFGCANAAETESVTAAKIIAGFSIRMIFLQSVNGKTSTATRLFRSCAARAYHARARRARSLTRARGRHRASPNRIIRPDGEAVCRLSAKHLRVRLLATNSKDAFGLSLSVLQPRALDGADVDEDGSHSIQRSSRRPGGPPGGTRLPPGAAPVVAGDCGRGASGPRDRGASMPGEGARSAGRWDGTAGTGRSVGPRSPPKL